MDAVVLLLGEEPFLRREEIRSLLDANPHLEVSRFVGDEAPCGRVLDELRTPTLFGGARAVVVDDAGALLEGDALRAVAAYAARPAPGAMLLLSAPKLDGRLKGAKELRASARVVACEPLREREVAGWIVRRAQRAHGLRVDAGAAESLRERIGEDLGLLDAALQRLRDLVAPRTRITEADVSESTEDHRSPVLFEAANALSAGDRGRALRATAAAFEEGVRVRQATVTDEGGIALILLGQLHQAYTKLLRFHLFRAGGAEEPEAAKRAGVSPQALHFFLRDARGHRREDLVERHRHFVEAEWGLKQGGLEPRPAVERLLLALLPEK